MTAVDVTDAAAPEATNDDGPWVKVTVWGRTEQLLNAGLLTRKDKAEGILEWAAGSAERHGVDLGNLVELYRDWDNLSPLMKAALLVSAPWECPDCEHTTARPYTGRRKSPKRKGAA